MENITEHIIQINGRHINYAQAGSGEPMIFLHNGGGFWQTWKKQVLHYSKTHQVFAIDWPGFGESSIEKSPISLALLTKTLSEFIIQLNLNEVILIGNCIGGSAALKYNMEHPENVKKLIVFNICPGRGIYRKEFYAKLVLAFNNKPRLKRMLSKILDFAFTKTFIKKKFPAILFSSEIQKTDFLFQKYVEKFTEKRQTDVRINMVFAVDSFTLNNWFDQKKSVPLNLIWGENNQVTPLQKHGYSHKEILQPQNFEVIKNGSHLCMYEQDEVCNAIINKYLYS